MKITTLKQLQKAVNDKKSIHCPSSVNYRKHRPAAFAINYIGHVLLHLFNQGMYIYKPKNKKKNFRERKTNV